MINLKIVDKKIELIGYSPDTTLSELSAAIEEFRKENRVKMAKCRGCGKCCFNPPVIGCDIQMLAKSFRCTVDELAEQYLVIPDLSGIKARRKGISELAAQNRLSELEAAVLYEYNQSEPVSFKKNEDGSCFLLKDGICSIYGYRPHVCRLYHCIMGEKLSEIEEMVASQGTWHAYSLLGLIGKEDISHNPFVKSGSYDSTLVKDFEFGMENALKELFFYY